MLPRLAQVKFAVPAAPNRRVTGTAAVPAPNTVPTVLSLRHADLLRLPRATYSVAQCVCGCNLRVALRTESRKLDPHSASSQSALTALVRAVRTSAPAQFLDAIWGLL